LGLSYRKVTSIPAKANPEEQEKFLNEVMAPDLQKAKNGKISMYYVDAGHFVEGSNKGYVWSSKPVLVKAPSGRQRHNVLAALDPITKKLIMVTNDTYITSIQVCELLAKIKASSKPRRKIRVYLDNARYQRCDLVMAYAKKLRIDLVWLPTYSPNLNLIERVWRFTRTERINSIYYSSFTAFKGAITNLLETAHETHKNELETLLAPNFQLFKLKQTAQPFK
jgi:transposase